MTMLTASEVATQLAISGRKVYALAACGDLASHRFGAAVRFSQEDVDTYVQASRQAAAPKARLATLTLQTSRVDSLSQYFEKARARRKK
jgi:excisionase family DNA binding protein